MSYAKLKTDKVATAAERALESYAEWCRNNKMPLDSDFQRIKRLKALAVAARDDASYMAVSADDFALISSNWNVGDEEVAGVQDGG